MAEMFLRYVIALLAALRETASVETLLTSDVKAAAGFIRRGGLVAFPTETVYGLGANVFDADAVARIFEAKQRPADNPLIAHVAHIEQIAALTTEVSDNAAKLIRAFFPGPLTVVLPRSPKVPEIATAGLDTIGVRMPGDALAHRFLDACGVPVVAPSANLSGMPSPTTWQAVLEDLGGRIDCILQGEPTKIGLESTVVDCSGVVPVLLRSGSILLDDVRRVIPTTEEYSPSVAEPVRSPGLKHRHYSPKARVILVWSGEPIADRKSSAYIGINKAENGIAISRICQDTEEYARSVFEFFRECDRLKLATIYCEAVEPKGIGTALMDRLRRAAEG